VAVIGFATAAASSAAEVTPYVRLDLGYAIGEVSGSSGDLGTGAGFGNDFGSSVTFGGGAGVKFSGGSGPLSFRFDLTADASPSLGGGNHSATLADGTPISAGVKISNQIYLANLYADFDIGGPLVPFVGVGAGGTYSQLKAMTFSNPAGNFAVVDGRNSSGAAVAAMVGAGYDLPDNFTLEAAYHYIYAGVVKSGAHITDITQNPPAVFLLDRPIASSLTLHELVVTLRYAF
jgi:opacity protein-like surface antigen